MSYEFMTCLSRLGSIGINGPVTGERYDITAHGSWVKGEDVEKLLELEVEIFCRDKPEKIKPFFRGHPTIDDMARKPVS
jgi:hypothetical protein